MTSFALELGFFLSIIQVIIAGEACPKSLCDEKTKFWLASTKNEKGQWIAETGMEHSKKSSGWKLQVDTDKSDCDGESYCRLVATISANCNETEEKDDYETLDIGRYKLYDTLMNWTDAKKKCESEGAHLAIVDSQAEVAVIKQVFQPSSSTWAFMGFSDQETEGVFIDIFGKKVKPFWLKGQPDNYKNIEDCGSVSKEGLLNDLPCEAKTSFICEKPK